MAALSHYLSPDQQGSASVAPACPEPFTSYQGLCLFFSSIRLNWFEAKSACSVYGGKLVEIESDAKQTAVTDARSSAGITGEFWIGLNDLATEGSFVWASTGEPAVIANWVEGQPNNWLNQDCVMVDGNQWVDDPCTNTGHFVCECFEAV